MAVHFSGHDNFHGKIKLHTSYDTIYTSIITHSYNMEVMLTYNMFYLGNSPVSGNYPKENILHIEHGESLKSTMLTYFAWNF